MTYDKRILVLIWICYLTFLYFFYTKEQDETVEWKRMTYNGVLKYTGQILIRDLSISGCKLSRNGIT